MNGKGDRPRNCYSEQYRDNYDRIYRSMRTKKIPLLHEQRPRLIRATAGTGAGGRKQAAAAKASTTARTRRVHRQS